MAVLGLHCCTSFSLVVGSGGYSLVVVQALLTAVPSLARSSRVPGLRQLWCTGLAAPRHVGSSRTRDRTHVFCMEPPGEP